MAGALALEKAIFRKRISRTAFRKRTPFKCQYPKT
jgi:hypothetical protein